MHAVDISADALTLARENAERLGIPDRIHFSQSHLLEKAEGAFDLIVANLPYVAASEAAQLAPELRYEPSVALFGGTEGDELIRELIATAPPHLRAGGFSRSKSGPTRETLCAPLSARRITTTSRLKNDYAGTARFLFARHG